jgi:hypothetical protein
MQTHGHVCGQYAGTTQVSVDGKGRPLAISDGLDDRASAIVNIPA